MRGPRPPGMWQQQMQPRMPMQQQHQQHQQQPSGPRPGPGGGGLNLQALMNADKPQVGFNFIELISERSVKD